MANSNIVVLLFLFLAHTAMTTTGETISVGFLYCDEEELFKAQDLIEQLNEPVQDSSSSPKLKRLKLELKSLQLNENENIISVPLLVCNNLMSNASVYAVIVGKTSCMHNSDSEYIEILSAIFFTCAYYQIPVLDLYSRYSDFSDKVSCDIENRITKYVQESVS
jgi:hypothetical protein